MIITENKYSVLPTTDGGMVLAIKIHPFMPENPKIFYAKGKHAVLSRRKDELVVLDYLHNDAQKILEKSSRILITEIDYSQKKVINDYMAPVEIVKKLPVEIKEIKA